VGEDEPYLQRMAHNMMPAVDLNPSHLEHPLLHLRSHAHHHSVPVEQRSRCDKVQALGAAAQPLLSPCEPGVVDVIFPHDGHLEEVAWLDQGIDSREVASLQASKAGVHDTLVDRFVGQGGS
jgi:hypothetical protein